MPSILDEMDKWELDGVPFLTRASRVRGGRKTATHEFVNSDRRVVEDLGLLQKSFKLQAIIDNRDSQYFLRRNALINVLEKGGKLVLTHAFFGKFDVVAMPYTLNERIDELGAAMFDLTFERAEETIEPLPDAFTISSITEARVTTLNNVGQDIEDNFEVSAAFPFNFTAAVNQLEGIGAAADEFTETFDQKLSQVDNFAKVLNDFRNTILRLVNLPGKMQNTLKNLYNSAVALAQTPSEAFQTLEKFFGFGDDAEIIPLTTFERIERDRNQNLLTVFMQVGALSLAYESAANIDFFTVREIDVFANKLNAQYNKVAPSITNNVTFDNLRNLRDLTSEFLDQQRLNVKKIVDFETQPTTAQALAYQLYGSVDDFEKLVQLNVIKDVDFVAGSVEVFRDQG